VHLSGSVGDFRPAQLVLDPLFARALVVKSGKRKLCLIAVDLTIVTARHADRIRRAAAEGFGFDPDAVMIHATQTHSAPSLGNFILSDEFEGVPDEFEWLRGSQSAYNAFAEERILAALRVADESLQPVQVGAGNGLEGRLAHNRRAVRRDGSVFMPGKQWVGPLGPTDLLYVEGPIDPTLGVVCFRAESLALPAVLVNYTCHPVHVFPKPFVSADWPGALAAELQKTLPAGCVPIVTNGACGNINPWATFDPDYVCDHRPMGSALAATACKVLETLQFAGEAAVDWRSRRLRIPLREIDPAQLAEARQRLREHPEPVWADEARTRVDTDWVIAAGRVDLANLRERDPEYEYEVQVFRVGDTAFVGLPGEPFVEGGLRIKLASPAKQTQIVHCINQYVGYLPTREAFARGGHELTTGNWSRLVPEALDTIVTTATELLSELFLGGDGRAT